MTKDEALKQALEALEQLQGGCTDHDDGTVEAITVWCPEVIEAIEEALAQPERPWVGLTDDEIKAIVDHNGLVEGGVLYTSPPASKPWLGLTEDDKTALWRIGCNQWTMDQVEAKLREKNT